MKAIHKPEIVILFTLVCIVIQCSCKPFWFWKPLIIIKRPIVTTTTTARTTTTVATTAAPTTTTTTTTTTTRPPTTIPTFPTFPTIFPGILPGQIIYPGQVIGIGGVGGGFIRPPIIYGPNFPSGGIIGGGIGGGLGISQGINQIQPGFGGVGQFGIANQAQAQGNPQLGFGNFGGAGQVQGGAQLGFGGAGQIQGNPQLGFVNQGVPNFPGNPQQFGKK